MARIDVGHRVVFGVGPVRELLAAGAGRVACVYVVAARAQKPGDPVADVAERARRAKVPVSELSREELDRLADDGNHQGVVAVTGEFRYAELEDLAAAAIERPPGLLVALDGVTDPHNLGAILRSAFLFGAHGVIVPRDRAAGITPIVAKASAGASERIAIAQVVNLARALADLKEAGLWIAAVASGPGARPLWQLDASAPVCLVLGSEGKGLRPLVAKQADYALEIPMEAAAVGSFNVSVAAAIALYEVSRQRRAGG